MSVEPPTKKARLASNNNNTHEVVVVVYVYTLPCGFVNACDDRDFPSLCNTAHDRLVECDP